MKTANRAAMTLCVIVAAIIVLIAASLSAPPGVHAAPPAQTGDPISHGETVTGWLDEQTACLYYTFTGAAGDAVVIDMQRTSGDLDGTLALYQGDGIGPTDTPIAENDDRPGSGSLDPLIETTLPATGSYTIAACRLQAAQMRVTSGDFALILDGPATASGPTPTPASALSNSLFGNPTPPPEDATTTSTPSDAPVMVADGDIIDGSIAADQTAVSYALAIESGDLVELTWTRTDGDLSPQIRVTSSSGVTIAEAASVDPTGELRLVFSAPYDDTLHIDLMRYDAASTATTGTFRLTVRRTPAQITDLSPDTPAAGEPATSDAAADSGGYDLANACQSGDQAVSGLGSSDVLVDVYLAAGDSYYVEELTRTDVFRTDDDLNVVFRVQNTADAVTVGGVFCAPDGSVYETGESDFEVGGPSLVGLDWEYLGEAWLPGEWIVEIYVDGTLNLTMRFTVAG